LYFVVPVSKCKVRLNEGEAQEVENATFKTQGKIILEVNRTLVNIWLELGEMLSSEYQE